LGRRVRLQNPYEVLALGTNSLKSMTVVGTFLKALEMSALTWYIWLVRRVLHTNIVPVWVITACPVMPAIVTNTVEEPVLGALSCACDTVGGGPFASVSKPGMELIF